MFVLPTKMLFHKNRSLNGENVSIVTMLDGHRETEFPGKALFIIKLADTGEKIVWHFRLRIPSSVQPKSLCSTYTYDFLLFVSALLLMDEAVWAWALEGKKQNITPVACSSCQLWSLIWNGLWLCIKSLYLSVCASFRHLRFTQSSCLRQICFQSWALGCTWHSQASQDCILKESICLLLSTLCLVAVKLHWFSQYCNVPMTLGKNACTSLLQHTQQVLPDKKEAQLFKYWEKGCPSSLEIFLCFFFDLAKT